MICARSSTRSRPPPGRTAAWCCWWAATSSRWAWAHWCGPCSRSGVVTHVALNGAAAIHDFELAAFGGTSEDVESGLADGSFGMAEETGAEMNAAIRAAAAAGEGMGEGLARALASTRVASRSRGLGPAGRPRARRAGHGARGDRRGDHPPASRGRRRRDRRDQPSRLPAAGRVAARPCTRAGRSSTWAARSCCRRSSSRRSRLRGTWRREGPTHFLAADFDMQRHYRPRLNVVQRPTRAGGAGYLLTGHHELLLPMLVWGVLESLGAG